MFKVKSRLALTGERSYDKFVRENGELGPFDKRAEAERALIALCQAGQATSGEIVDLAAEGLKNVAELLNKAHAALRCRYEDCTEQHPIAEEDEKVTCANCRNAMGLDAD